MASALERQPLEELLPGLGCGLGCVSALLPLERREREREKGQSRDGEGEEGRRSSRGRGSF